MRDPSVEAGTKAEQPCVQAGGGLLFQGDNSGSYLTLNESVVDNNYVDSASDGSSSPGLGGKLLVGVESMYAQQHSYKTSPCLFSRSRPLFRQGKSQSSFLGILS